MPINKDTNKLRENFKDRIQSEIKKSDINAREDALIEMANLFVATCNPISATIFGTVTTLKAIPKITVTLYPEFSQTMERKINWMHNYINSTIDCSLSHKKILIDSYMELIKYAPGR
ncbi:MAG: hypothetical protein DCF12_22200 [Snowella sp.]|nr:MAG: hypothetical protein DCF12_22200 [Snowella sp.]